MTFGFALGDPRADRPAPIPRSGWRARSCSGSASSATGRRSARRPGRRFGKARRLSAYAPRSSFEGRLPVDGYGAGGFRVAGAVHRGPLALRSGGAGRLGAACRISRRSWNGSASFDVLLVGTGDDDRGAAAGASPRRARALEAAGAGGGDDGDAVGLPDLQRAAGRGAPGRGGADAGLSRPFRGGSERAITGRGLPCPTTSEDLDMAFELPDLPYPHDALAAIRHVEGDARVPPRHPPQGLCRQRQQGDRRHRVGGQERRGDRQGHLPEGRGGAERASSTTPRSTGTTASSGR